jgi:hypothetical protein
VRRLPGVQGRSGYLSVGPTFGANFLRSWVRGSSRECRGFVESFLDRPHKIFVPPCQLGATWLAGKQRNGDGGCRFGSIWSILETESTKLRKAETSLGLESVVRPIV